METCAGSRQTSVLLHSFIIRDVKGSVLIGAEKRNFLFAFERNSCIYGQLCEDKNKDCFIQRQCACRD